MFLDNYLSNIYNSIMNFPKLNMSFPRMCSPALLYLILSIIGMIFSLMSMTAMANIMHLVFIGIWTWFLNFLCMKGYNTVSWFLVVAPYVFCIIMFGITLDTLMRYSGTAPPSPPADKKAPPAPPAPPATTVVPYAKQ